MNNNFVTFLATSDSTYYALTIKNVDKLKSFFFSENNDIDQNNIDQLELWRNSHIELDKLREKYYNHETTPLIREDEQSNATSLVQFLNFLDEADMGVELFETDENFEDFSLLKLKNGIPQRNNCNN